MAYPYSNTIAFRIDKLYKTIKHNILVESVGNITTEHIGIDCDRDMYLVVELCSGDINLIDGPMEVKQSAYSLGLSICLILTFDKSVVQNLKYK